MIFQILIVKKIITVVGDTRFWLAWIYGANQIPGWSIYILGQKKFPNLTGLGNYQTKITYTTFL